MLGNKDSVICYLKLLKRLESGGSISILSVSPDNWRAHCITPGRRLTSEEISELAKNLPLPPWSKDIHKRVATELGTSNNVISNAIDKILGDENLMTLLGENVKYS